MKRRYRRDYIILESKDSSFKLKEKTSPKAFAKIEMRDDRANLMLYVENVKYIRGGYRVVIVEDDLTVKDVGRVLVDESGKGEFKISFNEQNLDIKAVALTYEKKIPLIGFKGKKVQDYESIIFAEEYTAEENVEEENIEDDVDELEIDDDLYQEDIIEDNLDEPDLEIEEELPRKEEEVIVLNIDKKEEKKNEEKKEEEYLKEEKEEKIKVENIQEDISRNYNYNKEKMYFVPRKLKKFLKRYREIKPFIEEIEYTRWWKIDISPISMCGYVMPYLGYVNYINCILYSDITSLSYKYRHYIFGIKYGEDGKRKYYIYGIPGKKNEQPDEGDTGFCHFVPCSNRRDDYGYWLCFIDCKSRLIAVAEE
ncbi:hypothetical protein [Tepidibacter thalassicus]|uniref:Transmembrane protein n=1 Tax=Tepidibacter thalassicus DSM 15285 TaxID=1123350 RepID=A0A1M5SHA7_9FIRM|nr:hypothetical protein [Tepidibacter thalassicus]SHH37977.1 hypothetical protein SAMN02744040_01772 [Tepidibacter thalassicus DSM 15285]